MNDIVLLTEKNQELIDLLNNGVNNLADVTNSITELIPSIIVLTVTAYFIYTQLI